MLEFLAMDCMGKDNRKIGNQQKKDSEKNLESIKRKQEPNAEYVTTTKSTSRAKIIAVMQKRVARHKRVQHD